ncbi:hypothetical protein MASR2M39_29810 [Ignavibacteriales bacterium]
MLYKAVVKAGLKPVNPIGDGFSLVVQLLRTDFALQADIESSAKENLPQKEERLSVEDLQESGIIEEYLTLGGTLTGSEWLDFFKKIKKDFIIDSLLELKALVELKQSTKTIKISTPETIRITEEPTLETIEKVSTPVCHVEMISVEGDTFTMGSNEGDSDEKPTHRVTISSFMIGKYEVTQELWENVMGDNPSKFRGSNRPVERVS